jgi:hypothetical protein
VFLNERFCKKGGGKPHELIDTNFFLGMGGVAWFYFGFVVRLFLIVVFYYFIIYILFGWCVCLLFCSFFFLKYILIVCPYLRIFFMFLDIPNKL